MIRRGDILFLTLLMTSAAFAAPINSEEERHPAVSSPTTPSAAHLKSMPTVRLLKIGQAALNASIDTPAFSNGLDALKIASSRGDRIATRMLAKVMARHQVDIGSDNRSKFESKLRYEALHGASSSVLAIAGMYDRGDGMPVDTKKAAQWYLWAARVGNRRAMAHVAYAYGTGRGLERNEETALKWLDDVNSGRSRMTLLEIGWALATGTEGPADMPAALRFFEKVAQINPSAAYQVALDLERGTNGVQDRDAARHLIEIAAERGDSAAATHIADKLASSDRVEDQRQAVQWYSLAARDKDNVAAGQGLSRFLALRSKGDLVPSIISGLEKAAEAGNREALVGLAQAYSEGIGVEASQERAATLFEQASDMGLPEAKYRLGLMYKAGIGVSADMNKAVELMKSAQESGFPLAALALSEMMEPSATGSATEPETPEPSEARSSAK